MKFCVPLILIAALAVAPSGCRDLDKYRKPAEQQPASELQVKSVDIKGTPQEREQGRQFKERLDAVRAQLAADHDTTSVLTALDRLLAEAEAQRRALPQGSEFGMFYLIMAADMLNDIAALRRAIGDEQGALSAETRLNDIARLLPH